MGGGGGGGANILARSKLTGMQQLPSMLYGLFAVMVVLLLLFQEGKRQRILL